MSIAGLTKKLILFVHGVGGSGTGTWGDFPALVRRDPELSACC